MKMKKLLMLLAVVGLVGCAALVPIYMRPYLVASILPSGNYQVCVRCRRGLKPHLTYSEKSHSADDFVSFINHSNQATCMLDLSKETK